MLILGAISGIQDFVFAVPEEEGGQARMLRARSFFVQVLAEVVAFRIQGALGLGRETLLFCAAGRFVLDAPVASDVSGLLHEARGSIEEWLLRATAGTLRLTVVAESASASGSGFDGLADRYERTASDLLAQKYHAWAAYGASGGVWAPGRLVVSAVPSAEAPGSFREIGRALPKAQWLLVEGSHTRDRATRGVSFDLAGLRATLLERAMPSDIQRAALAADLGDGRSPAVASTNHIHRPLARHIPTSEDGAPSWFQELAQRSRGAALLGVLKMDADSLGIAFREHLRAETDVSALRRFSSELDDFFAVELDEVLRTDQWEPIYTVFSGGDDLLLVGPWDLMLDFAGHAQGLFAR